MRFVEGDTKVEKSRKVDHVSNLVSGTGFEWRLVLFPIAKSKEGGFFFVVFLFFPFHSQWCARGGRCEVGRGELKVKDVNEGWFVWRMAYST